MAEILANNISLVRSDELKQALRLDPDYYSPRFELILLKLKKNKTIRLADTLIEPVKTGHTPSTKNIKNYIPGTIKFIKTDNLREDFIDDTDVHLISEYGNSKIEGSELHPKDVIITIIGATEEIIGRAARIFSDIGRANINQNIALIRSTIASGYLTVFLNTKYGREQLIRLSRQTGQVNLNCREIEKLLIPLFSEKIIAEIHDINTQRNDLLQKSIKLYFEAECLLLDELGMKDINLSHDVCYEVNSSETLIARRIDAEYYQPKYERVISAIKNCRFGWCKLTDRVENIRNKYEPRKELEKAFRYIELSNINPSIGIIDGYSEMKGKDLPSRARMLIRRDDVIISSVEGSIDKIALVDGQHAGCLASTGFFIFRSKENILPEYTLALCKSVLIQKQLEKLSSGTILTAVPRNLVQEIILPAVPIEVQKEIASLIQKSHSARRLAKELLEEAKRKVEKIIEKGQTS